MKILRTLPLLLVIIASACAPSPRAIETAMAQTQAAWTPTPAPTSTPKPTSTPDPKAIYLDKFVDAFFIWRDAFKVWNDLNQRILDDASILKDDAVIHEISSSLVGLGEARKALKALPDAPAGLEELQENGEKLANYTEGLVAFYVMSLSGDEASANLLLTTINGMGSAVTRIIEILKENKVVD